MKLLMALALFASVCTAAEKTTSAGPTLSLQLRVQKAALENHSIEQLSKALTEIGFPAVATDEGKVEVTFVAPWKARDLAMTWAWRKPHAISADAGLESWKIMTQTRATKVTRKAALLFENPQIGPWELEAHLVARPSGKLPKKTFGASPAYDLNQYDGMVDSIIFRPLRKKN